MRSSEPTIRASVLTAMPPYMRDHGVDIHELLPLVGLSSTDLSDGDLLVPFRAAAHLFDLAARRLGDPVFGISFASTFPRGGSGLIGQVVMTAPTVRDAFHSLKKLLQVHVSPVETNFVEGEGIARFDFTWPSTIAESKHQITDFYLALLILRLRNAAGAAWLPLAVDFEHRLPENLEPYHRMFGTRLAFNRKQNAVVVDATTLSKRMPEIYEGLHESLVELGERRLKEQVTTTSIAARLQALLSQHLANEAAFDLETVAAGMGLPTRALQWRLGQDGTSYEKVLLATRRLEAERYLRDSSHQLTRVAALLGFSEPSAFTRWSQKHFKMTPSAMRRHLRRGGASLASPGDDPPRA